MIDPATLGSRYQYTPQTPEPPPEQQASPYDNVPVTPTPRDPGFERPQNPDNSEIGPLYVSPEGVQWIDEHVWTPGYTIDWKNRTVINPGTGEVVETVPTSVPRMV